ncbi:ParA family protein [unidentified bacterial endosymbiont]|uniref:ParA family protein n=1 Tax=unidentified bacterial endosymbiont TaxID=2355 RepID=UPI0020A07B38|nr:ParA family protein [unidentified bacterial endosymbiont]
MKSVAMFNNKGGVGKTTLTCNLASFIAMNFNKKVLVVDCDPQCNSTQLIMGVENSAELYLDPNPTISTIKDVLQPIEDGDSTINTELTFLKSSDNRFGVDLLPGHPYFAIIEDRLGVAWGQLRGRDRQGFRQTNWNTLLCNFLEDKYDLVMFDLGPSLGSINRSVLMGCQHFLTPLGSDVFSIIGVKNISSWLNNWIDDYNHSWSALTPEERSVLQDRFSVLPEPRIKKGFIGYTVQLYITKSYGQERRATKAYEAIIGDVDNEIRTSLIDFYSDSLIASPQNSKLGDIQHLYSLVPLAQKQSVPIHALTSTDGLVGSQFSAVREFSNKIRPIAENLLKNLGMSVQE